MPDGTLLITLSPATAYATKKGLLYPGAVSAEAAVESAADSRIEDSLPVGATVAGINVTANGE